MHDYQENRSCLSYRGEGDDSPDMLKRWGERILTAPSLNSLYISHYILTFCVTYITFMCVCMCVGIGMWWESWLRQRGSMWKSCWLCYWWEIMFSCFHVWRLKRTVCCELELYIVIVIITWNLHALLNCICVIYQDDYTVRIVCHVNPLYLGISS